jgi:AraC-like DNA-binding protein
MSTLRHVILCKTLPICLATCWIRWPPTRRLDAAWLAGRLGLSRATLYRLFEPFGGVGQYLLHRRILRLRRLLAERDQRASFEVLASQAGFLSESHASRVFLNRFHYRPGLFRRNARHLSDTEHAALCMAIWQDDLR